MPPAAPRMADLDVCRLPPKLPRWRRLWKRERMMHYNRLIAAAIAVNLLVLGWGLSAGWWQGPTAATVRTLSDVVLVNLAVALLIRQHYVINLLFWLATRAPTHWPLSLRAALAKVYHFGGIHVGAAISGTLWHLALFTTVATSTVGSGSPPPLVLSIVVSAQTALLLAICAVSRWKVRSQNHDAFEVIKRFAGWLSLALFWVQIVLLTANPATAPQTWVLFAVTISIALPWLRLRKVPLNIVTPSKHVALASFDYGVTPFAGSSTAISRRPLLEWHSFANIPVPNQTGFRLAIARAGDFTGHLIDDPPSHVWVKGIPTAGVANIEVLFKRVIYVATGSGIGPCLPHLLARKVPARLVWATRDPRATFGDAMVDEILAKHPDALIWDTGKHGKPDMVVLAHRLFVEFEAEAVICISNKKLTWHVVSGMESRGIPAYGAIWDS